VARIRGALALAADVTAVGRSSPPQPGLEPNAPVLVFDRVRKRFADGTVALDCVDLRVPPREFVAVVGPSGCGKSTLLRIASGLETATGGTVRVGAARVGHVFQDPTLLPWRTVSGNVELPGELEGLGRAERRRLAREALELVGLEEFAGHLPHALSGGMRMRASLARSLTLRPELFLFDEPFGALDEITRERLNDELQRLFLARRFAALLVTHSVSEAVFLSRRVVVLSSRPGRVVASFEVPFSYPRTAELRYQEPFASIAGAVSACLRRGLS
jgi:NitT/TauT family transport system ATP-binding protein